VPTSRRAPDRPERGGGRLPARPAAPCAGPAHRRAALVPLSIDLVALIAKDSYGDDDSDSRPTSLLDGR
jgi:hypothetical protein